MIKPSKEQQIIFLIDFSYFPLLEPFDRRFFFSVFSMLTMNRTSIGEDKFNKLWIFEKLNYKRLELKIATPSIAKDSSQRETIPYICGLGASVGYERVERVFNTPRLKSQI